MEHYYKIQLLGIVSLLLVFPNTHGWGEDGHAIICRIAQSRLSDSAAEAVKKLLPKYAQDDLGSVCSWADHVRFYLHWSAPLHFADTPDSLCNFQYNRDCKDENGEKGRCVVGAIKNYTSQLLDNGKDTQYNLTQALLFLSHFMGDVHQPLHVGFTSDRGANLINVHWYTKKQNLHHVWDASIIETAEETFYDSNIDAFTKAIQENITKTWSGQVKGWETCNSNEATCPEKYASEGIQAACQWAYKDAPEGSELGDDYFRSRFPVVSLRLAQGGVRLAATLNRIFG
ncbi:endonuclease 2 [Cajanus cajan]|uniref:Aspergillus nuclease S1 n=1 Tax=Cajanus cajan TaxID=3821 RepID=A0A151RPN3_CAJCA|nr:endonuclease 2 [Cajanus cajan]KYP44502.1 Nuclease S1 [Cajanus cajan]